MLLRRLGMRSSTILMAASLSMIACSGKPSVPANANQQHTSPSDPAQTPGKTTTETISQFRFRPEALTVNLGDTVEWKNSDSLPHTATAENEKDFDSGSIADGASWRFTANKKGSFDYICTLHPNMHGKLVVQ